MKKILFYNVFIFISVLAFSQTQSKLQILYFNNQFQQVITASDSLLSKNPTNFEAWYYKGLAENSLYKFPEALTSFEKALVLTNDKLHLLFLMGNACESAGNNEKAIETYQLIIEIDSLHIPAKARLAKVYKNQKQYKLAIDMYSNLIEQDTTNGFFYAELAYCCNKFGLKQPVMYFYEKAIALNPYDFESCRFLVNEYIDRKYYEDALYYVDSFLTRFPKNVRLLKQKAYVYALGGNYLDAVNQFQEVVELGDSSLFTSKYYGQSLYNNGQYEESIYWLGRYLSVNKDDARNYFILGLACQHNYQYKKSVKYFDFALSQLYDKKLIARIYKETGNTYAKYGDYLGFRDSTGIKAPKKYDLALENYLLAEEIAPDDYTIYKVLGQFYETKIKDLKIALYYYEKYYNLLDTDKTDEHDFVWLQNKISRLKEEVHFIGD